MITEVGSEYMKRSSFWDIMPCSLLKVNRHIRGTCPLHLQSQASLFFKSEDGGDLYFKVLVDFQRTT
jgi:hypothetical protein